MFNFFKKKKEEPEYNPLDLKVTDLRKGFIFEYDLRQWEVQEEYTYDWGDNYYTFEYKVSDGTETRYLSIEEDDEIELIWMEKVRLSAFDEDIEKEILNNKRPPRQIIFNGIIYYREEESPGYYKGAKQDWTELISWTYYDETEKKALSIEQWGDRSFEASYGDILELFEISNIIPGSSE